MERMGFEKNRRFTKVYNNQPITATIGGKKYHYRSIFEYQWALYQQYRKEQGKISDWMYEETTFHFPGVPDYPRSYRTDFQIIELDGTIVVQELKKGNHDAAANKKFKRMQEFYPNVKIELVLDSIPKNKSIGANKRRIAEKYVREIINASEVLREIEGVVNLNPPVIQEL